MSQAPCPDALPSRAAGRPPGRAPLARPSPPRGPGPGTCTGAAELAARRLIPRRGPAARGGPAEGDPPPRSAPAPGVSSAAARAREGVPAIPGPLPVLPNPTGSAAALRLRPAPLLLLGAGRAWGSQPLAPRQFVAAAGGCEGAETTARTELPLPSGPRPAPHRRHRRCCLFSSAAGWGVAGGRQAGREGGAWVSAAALSTPNLRRHPPVRAAPAGAWGSLVGAERTGVRRGWQLLAVANVPRPTLGPQRGAGSGSGAARCEGRAVGQQRGGVHRARGRPARAAEG